MSWHTERHQYSEWGMSVLVRCHVCQSFTHSIVSLAPFNCQPEVSLAKAKCKQMGGGTSDVIYPNMAISIFGKLLVTESAKPGGEQREFTVRFTVHLIDNGWLKAPLRAAIGLNSSYTSAHHHSLSINSHGDLSCSPLDFTRP